jgi:hypothetical protein
LHHDIGQCSDFASQVIKNDPAYMLKVLYDHGANDLHDV